MISVEMLYQRLQDLSRKNQSGYSSNEEFNRNLIFAQNSLFEYYVAMMDADSRIHGALSRFISDYSFTPLSDVSLPIDYRRRLNAMCSWYVASCGETKVEVCPDFLETDEDCLVLTSAILKPSIDNKIVAYQIEGDLIKVHPKFNGQFVLKYLRYPTIPVRGVTIVNDIEVYDVTQTTELEWGEEEINNFIDIILYFKGMEVKDSSLIQFLANKKIVND
jgi:hypothetical protein